MTPVVAGMATIMPAVAPEVGLDRRHIVGHARLNGGGEGSKRRVEALRGRWESGKEAEADGGDNEIVFNGGRAGFIPEPPRKLRNHFINSKAKKAWMLSQIATNPPTKFRR
jgi:hypothetical protein